MNVQVFLYSFPGFFTELCIVLVTQFIYSKMIVRCPLQKCGAWFTNQTTALRYILHIKPKSLKCLMNVKLSRMFQATELLAGSQSPSKHFLFLIYLWRMVLARITSEYRKGNLGYYLGQQGDKYRVDISWWFHYRIMFIYCKFGDRLLVKWNPG